MSRAERNIGGDHELCEELGLRKTHSIEWNPSKCLLLTVLASFF